jgi:hypothetical protein
MGTGENFSLRPGLYLGYREGNWKKGGEGLKVLIFYYVPQSHTVPPSRKVQKQWMGTNDEKWKEG